MVPTERLTFEMRAEMWRGARLVHEEEHTLHINLYFKNELLLMLERAGFGDAHVFGGNRFEPARPGDDFIAFVAQKP